MGEKKQRRQTSVRIAWNKEQIRALRQHLQLTQREMAEELEVRQQTISEWETGIHQPHRSTMKVLTMIAERAEFPYSTDTPEMPPAESD